VLVDHSANELKHSQVISAANQPATNTVQTLVDQSSRSYVGERRDDINEANDNLLFSMPVRASLSARSNTTDLFEDVPLTDR